MRLIWVNHASYILESGDIRIITDPWLYGSAFDDGWKLLCDSTLSVDNFDDITHIWFSHEHPDHFSPPVLLAIPEPIRARITVLFQSTRDRRVAKFCQKLGFIVKELGNRVPYQLSNELTLTCGKVRPIDSWLLVETPHLRILNLNDCIVDNETKAQSIKKTVGKIDVLLTQFAYAQWVGNPGERLIMEEAKLEKFRRIRLQSQVFKPKWICPFASFVYFSHQENSYLNEFLANIHEAASFIETATDARPLVFYPGDRWNAGETWNNKASLALYDEQYRQQRTFTESYSPVCFSELKELGEKYLLTARKLGSPSAIKCWAHYNAKRKKRPWVLNLYLTDIETHVSFDWRRGLTSSSNVSSEVELSSSSLAYILKHDWGVGTIRVNGRYRATAEGRKVFTDFFPFGTLHSLGKSLNWRFVFGSLTDLLLRKLFGYSRAETEEEPSFAGLWNHYAASMLPKRRMNQSNFEEPGTFL